MGVHAAGLEIVYSAKGWEQFQEVLNRALGSESFPVCGALEKLTRDDPKPWGKEPPAFSYPEVTVQALKVIEFEEEPDPAGEALTREPIIAEVSELRVVPQRPLSFPAAV